MEDETRAQTLYLHIGTEKTGSTTLQNVSHINRNWLRQAGILYPRNQLHSGLSGYAAAMTLAPVTTKYFNIDGPDDLSRFREGLESSLASQVRTGKFQKVLLTSERLSAYIRRRKEIKRLASLAESIAENVKIVIYIRNQADLFLSAYSSRLKAGQDEDMRPPVRPGLYYYDYEKMLDRWADVFGQENMVVRIFDRRQLKAGDIIADFFSLLGIDDITGLIRKADRNPRLDAKTMQYLRLFNRSVGDVENGRKSPLRGMIASVLADMSDGPKYTVPASVVAEICDAYAESNARVAAKYFNRTDGVLFEPTDYTDEPYPKLTVEEAVEIGAKLWVWQQERNNEFLAAKGESSSPLEADAEGDGDGNTNT